MDLGKWLRDRKKQAEGVIAQVNPFDNGKTYSTVTRKPTVDPFQSNNVNARYGVLADKGRRDQFIRENQPTSFNAPAATFESLNNLLNKTRDVFDANTQSDITKRVSQGQPANYFDQQRQNNKVPGNSRGTVGQMVYPFVGSVSDFVGSLPGKTLQLAGNALQEPAQYVSKQIRQNPFTHPLGLPGYTYENVKKTVDKINGNQKSTNVFDQTTKLADQSVPEVVKNYGRGLQGYGEQGEDIVSKKINESRFTPQSRQGENRLITNLSSGLGSLGTSIAATVITKNPAAISAAFGLNAAAETTRDARDNGLSASEALDVGTKRGVAEGMLEKFGLERLFNGAKGKLVQTAINSVTTEAPQEFLQSLAGSVAQSQYKPVDWGKAFQQAFTEGAVGGLVGIIGGAAIDIGGFSNSLQENGVEKPNADFIAEEIAKKQAETKVQQQNPILQQTNIPAQPGSIRERIQQAKENVKSTIVNSQLIQNEGGYIRIPDFGKNLPNKPVKINTGGGDYNSKSPVSDSPLSPMEAVSEYQDYGYSTVNDALRENKITPRAKHLIDGLDNAFNKIGENRGVYTHRYDGAATSSELFEKTGIDKELKQFEDIKHEEFYNNQDKIQQIIKKLEGQEFTDKAYLSTSREKSGAEKFGDGGGISRYGIPAMVRISGETRVIDVARNGFTDNEQELLLPRNTSYRIKRAELLPTLREGYAGTRGEQYILGLDVEIIDKPGNNKTQVAKLLKDQGGGYDGGRNAADRVRALEAENIDPLESLRQEARKYKSAEEFVKNNFVAHGTNKEILGNLQPTNGWYGKAVYTTDDLANASGRNGGGVTYFVNKPQGKLLEINAHGSKGGSGFTPQQYQDAIKNGYDGLKIKHDDGKTWYAMFNEQTPHTKQQLTDLYNQATKGAKSADPLDPRVVDYSSKPKEGTIRLYTNTKGVNVDNILKDGLKTKQRLQAYGADPSEGSVSWFETTPNLKGYGGNTVAVDVPLTARMQKVNDTQYMVLDDLSPEHIAFVDRPLFGNYRTSDLRTLVDKYGVQKTLDVFEKSRSKNVTFSELKNTIAKLDNQATKKQGGLRTLMRDEGGGYTGKTSQERIGQAKFDAELRAKSAANLKKANIQITQGVANPKSDSPLTDKAYSETFGVSLEEAKKDIASINTSKTNPLDSVGMTEEQANKKLESRAVSMSPGNKKTKSLVDSMINDKKLTEAARIAQSEGKELNYFAKKDNNGRSVGIEEYNPSRQRIEAGFVVDNSTGKVLGNHIKVDATGTQINVGGEVVNISDVVGNPLDWKGDYEVSSTMERNIFKNAPNKEIAQKTYKFVVANKIQAEATLRKEIESQRKTLNQNVKDVQKVKPRSVSDKDFKADIFDFIENKKSQADIASKYGPKATQAIVKYKNETRKLYDTLLDRANTELAKFGEKTIPKRSDYITHINELNQQPSFAGELMGQLQNSMLGEGYTTTRGGVPGDIAGRTETFSPRKRWNPFAQQRKGGEYTKDPFKAVDSYLEPTLYNIHMTESAVRARAVESAFRTAEILKNTEATKVSTDLDRELEKYKKQSNNAKLVSGFQEYANALAGKTQRWDRQVIDASKGTATALKGWQGLQRIGGRATILGNINSVLMQPLNQASVIAEVKLPNYIKGVASSLAGNNVEDKSPFIRARAAKIESAFRSKGQKVMDKAGIPLQFVELASVKLAWNAEYQQVLSEGLKGQDAIIEADRRTEKAVAGRGIADKPELYRSTLTNGLLQYTLEVNAQNKKFWRDLTPVQKGKFMAAAFGMNTVMEAVTGNEPLPDFLGAAIDTFRDFLDDDDDTPLENAGKGVQRFASEAVSMNPMLSAGANLLPDSTKKTLFGSDSDLTRFEGVPAPIGVIQNAVDVGKNVANGDVKKARDSALKLIPGGNQIRKTLQGKELIQDGGKYDKNGKLQYPAPESPLGKAQALLFGPSATKNAREYYDSMSAKLSGATDKLASLKKDSSGKTIDDFKTIAQSAFNTDKGKEFMALTNDDERKEFARQSSENRGIYEQYKSMQKAFNGGDDLLPEGLSKESEAILNKYDRMEAKTKEDIFYRENDAEYKYELAKYEKDKLEGTISEVDAIRKEKSLAKQAIGSKYEKGIRDVYSLSKEQIEDLVTGDPAGKAIYDKLVKYDKELYDAGLISYLKFKNGLASGRGGRGRDKKDTSLTDKYALQGQTLSRLQKLLAGTTFAGAETVTTPKTQKAKQKKITVNMKA